MKGFNIAAFAVFFASTITASPIVEKRDRACDDCAGVAGDITSHHDEPLCASFLGYPVSTIVSTSTTRKTSTKVLPQSTATVFVTTGTNFVTSNIISLVSSTSTIVETQAVTEITVTVVTSTSTLELAKREPTAILDARGNGPSKPAYLNGVPNSKISSACSCLHVPTLRTTKVSSVLQTTTVTSTPLPRTVNINTFGIVTKTNIILQTSVLLTTETQLVTVIEISTSTEVIFETPSATPSAVPACSNPALDLLYPLRPIYDASLSYDLQAGLWSKAECCGRCFTTDNCISWTWDNAGSSSQSPQVCKLYVKSASLVRRPPTFEACSAGSLSFEALDITGDSPELPIWGIGPCDPAGIEYQPSW